MKHQIPEASIDKHIAFLGSNGSGKTSAAKQAIIEPALAAGERVLNIDPTGVGWGLRVRKDGNASGYDVAIFGGDHADYPLRVQDAAMFAEAYGTASGSAVFDTSLMTVADRTQWFTVFAETLLRKNKGRLKLVIDEAHLFMPQAGAKSGGGVPKMLHAGNNLISLGRSRGLRITLISQRAAKLHKDALSQAKTLVAMQMMAPQDREAVKDWVEDQADPAKGKEIIASLPTLQPGEAWVWSPLVGYLERVRFPLPATFDSSAAPDDDDAEGPKLAPINLDALKGKLAKIEAEKKANDIPTLRAENAHLTRSLAEARRAVNDPAAIEEAEKRGFLAGAAEHKNRMVGPFAGLENAWRTYRESGERVTAAMEQVLRIMQVALEYRASPKANVFPKTAPQIKRGTVSQPKPSTQPHVPSSGGLTRPQQRILNSLTFWCSIGQECPSREQVAAVAGYAPGSGNFNNIIGSLRAENHVGIPVPGHVALVNGAGGELMTADEAKEMLLSVLNGPQKKIVAALEGSTDATPRETVAERSEYAANSGNFNNLIGSLCTIGVLTKPQQGCVALSDWAAELLT